MQICMYNVSMDIINFDLKRISEQSVAFRKDKAVFRDGNKLIKLFDNNYSKSNVLNEAINQSRVEETGLNIPKIHEVRLVEGKWAIVMDFVEGTTLDKLMNDNPDKIDEYMSLFVSIQREVHSRKHMLLTKYADKLIMKILNSGLDASSRYDLSLRLDAMPKGTSVCHGDFNPSNIIITSDGKAYIIDWSHASQGNYIADVAKSYLLFKLNGEDERAEKYLAKYCKMAKITADEVFKWIPLVSAAQLAKADGEKREWFMNWIYEAE